VARSRPGLVTLAMSAAAVAGYVAYRFWAADVATPPAETAGAEAEASAFVETLPEFSLGNLAGDPQSIRSWPGKPLLINFWATWCGPCLREIPMLKALQEQRPDLQIVGIAIDRREPVEKFAADMSFNYPILIGQSEAWEAAASLGVNIFALPFTVFAGPDGSLLGVHTGELHAEHLENFRAVADDLTAGKIDIAEARLRIAQRM
jgi:thiol-disulfide isomerase/thioredoxin